VVRLNENEAFGPGANLWIVGDLAQSAWSRKLDWYLNLLILKAEPHRPLVVSPQIRTILQDQELESLDRPLNLNATAPLMVATPGYVPAEQVVVLYETQATAWIQSGRRVWDNLGRPAVRLFLPPFLPPAKLAWEDDSSVSFVAANDT
jgi:hypothetical protein